MDIGQRIRKARKQAGYTQPLLAQACGWKSQSRISMYEQGQRTPKYADLERIAGVLKTDVSHLLGNNTLGEIVRSASVRYYTEVLDAGDHGCVPVEDADIALIELTWGMLEKHNLNPQKSALLQVNDESMHDTICHGDFVLIDTSATRLVDGRVYALFVDDMVLVKRVQWVPGGMKLISDNPAYDSITLLTDEKETPSAELIGRVVIAWHPRVFPV